MARLDLPVPLGQVSQLLEVTGPRSVLGALPLHLEDDLVELRLQAGEKLGGDLAAQAGNVARNGVDQPALTVLHPRPRLHQ